MARTKKRARRPRGMLGVPDDGVRVITCSARTACGDLATVPDILVNDEVVAAFVPECRASDAGYLDWVCLAIAGDREYTVDGRAAASLMASFPGLKPGWYDLGGMNSRIEKATARRDGATLDALKVGADAPVRRLPLTDPAHPASEANNALRRVAFGLFATRDIDANTNLGLYGISLHAGGFDADALTANEYAFKMPDKTEVFVAEHKIDPRALLGYVNDPRRTGRLANCKPTTVVMYVGKDGRMEVYVLFATTRPVPRGAELLMHYGADYWKGMAKRIEAHDDWLLDSVPTHTGLFANRVSVCALAARAGIARLSIDHDVSELHVLVHGGDVTARHRVGVRGLCDLTRLSMQIGCVVADLPFRRLANLHLKLSVIDHAAADALAEAPCLEELVLTRCVVRARFETLPPKLRRIVTADLVGPVDLLPRDVEGLERLDLVVMLQEAPYNDWRDLPLDPGVVRRLEAVAGLRLVLSPHPMA